MAAMLLLSSTTYAQVAVTHNTSFSKKDAQALFGTHQVKVSTLNNSEMKKTEGEFWQFVPLLINVGLGVAGGYAATQINKPSKPTVIHEQSHGMNWTYTL